MNELLAIAKQPAPGLTKTRLTPPLNPAAAAELYEAFLRDTLDLIRSVPAAQPGVLYLPATARDYFYTLAPDCSLLLQEGDDLGARLDNAFAYCLTQRAAAKVVIMDTDSPTLPAAYLAEAFSLLDTADLVLGPCDDGGYYLIGLKRPAPRLLREVTMSTPHVVRDTLVLATALGLRPALLPPWYDVDTASELDRLAQELARLPADRAPHTRRTLARLLPPPLAGLEAGRAIPGVYPRPE
jgi:rSAM/selenodomain-associated transferase 1